MRFCKDCGSVLNLFSNHETELCPPCSHRKKLSEPTPSSDRNTKKKADGHDILNHAVLTTEGNRIIIRSKEGWELWSGPLNAPAELSTILQNAKRIYQIRLRRQKN